MIQLEIDGKQVSAEKGTSVLEAATQSGAFIPHFCYHKKLSIAANCRMCLVEVEKAPKPQPACATSVTEGMKVFTHSKLAKEAQRGVMEFLLINHPLDCPVCDQGGECQLQDLSVGYGQSASRYIESKRKVPPKDIGPLVGAIEMSRCIHCTRCIRFTQEIAGYQELGLKNRGQHSEITSFLGDTLDSELSGNVIDLCPVGALTSLPFRYNARTWELSRRKGISGHDSLGSHLEIQVKDKIVRRVLPRENEEINECWLSDKDRFAYEGLNHRERLHQPMIKQDNQWLEVDWETALQYVVKGLRGVAKDHGRQALGVWVNNNNTLEELYLLKKLAQGLGTDNIDAALRQQDRRYTASQKGALWLGQGINNFLNSDVILVVGAQLRQDQPLLTARIRQAVKAGTQLIVLQSCKEDLRIPGAKQPSVSPFAWASFLDKIKDKEDQELDFILSQGKKISIVLGEEAQLHPDFSHIYKSAQDLAEATGAYLGILPNAANAVGADLLGLVAKEEHSLPSMFATPKKAVILANVEPDLDTVDGQSALNALSQAETVIALSPYAASKLKEFADVLLPVSTYTETPGSFINMEGAIQSFYSTAPALGNTKPMWKVLRVLGSLLSLPGFEFQSAQEVLAAALLSVNLPESLNNKLSPLDVGDSRADDIAMLRVGGIAIYNTDAIVRRAAALQKTPQALAPPLQINSATAQLSNLSQGDTVYIESPEGEDVSLTIVINDSIADHVAYLPLHQTNVFAGALMGELRVKRG